MLKALFVIHLSMGVPGLALATALGTWVNLGVLGFLAVRRGHLVPEPRLVSGTLRMVAASAYAGVVAVLLEGTLATEIARLPALHHEALLVLLGLTGLASYVIALFALGWRR